MSNKWYTGKQRNSTVEYLIGFCSYQDCLDGKQKNNTKAPESMERKQRKKRYWMQLISYTVQVNKITMSITYRKVLSLKEKERQE